MGRFLLTLMLGLIITPSIYSDSSNDERSLEDRVRYIQRQRTDFSKLQLKHWRLIARTLSRSNSQVDSCEDVRFSEMTNKYLVSFDANNFPCRVYDLSMATFATRTEKSLLAKIPVQRFGARDYLNWLNGNYEAVNRKVSSFQLSREPIPQHQMSRWTKQIRFKNNASLHGVDVVGSTGLPREFMASDIYVGRRLELSFFDKETVYSALENVYGTQSGLYESDEFKAWHQLIEDPSSILSKIKFKWNDFEKVYEVLLLGEFLPIKGPISVADRGRPYKPAVEAILRNVVRSALNSVLRFVPGATGNLIQLVVNEAFDMVDQAYAYQLNQLEWTLNSIKELGFQTDVSRENASELLNLAAVGHANLINDYLLSIVSGKAYRWDRLEDLGRRTRYDLEKFRKINSIREFSKLAKKKDCTLQDIHKHFAYCKEGEKESLYSLLSNHKLAFFDLGPALIYRYDSPNTVLFMRGTSYLLSVATQLVPFPFSGNLSSMLKAYANAGIEDEAFIRAVLGVKVFTGKTMSRKEYGHFEKLYLQNLNPFLSKSRAGEEKVIAKNKTILEQN